MNFLKPEDPLNPTCGMDDFILDNFPAMLEYYRMFVENTPDIIYLIFSKPVCRLVYVSPSVTPLTGHSPEDFYASPELFKSLVHPDDLLKLEMNLKAPSLGSTWQLVSFRLRGFDKTFAEFELKIITPPDKTQLGALLCGVARKISPPLYDISHWERLNTISQMASSVAHEIRNPMTTVRGYLQFFSAKDEFTKYKEQFDLIINELDRTNLIIKEYLSLNQTKLSSPHLCQLNNIVQSIYPLLQADANNAGKEVKIYLDNIPELYLDEKEIRQLILNLVRNGLEAMAGINDRTTVSISVYQEGMYVILSVKDQGTGIAPNISANLGKAFYTTKEHGTGLGLMVCYKIAANHNARIKVESSFNGSNFFIKFPLPQKVNYNST